jgi:hypothetical protein
MQQNERRSGGIGAGEEAVGVCRFRHRDKTIDAYGAGELLKRLNDNGIRNGLKVQPSTAVKGHFPKDRFATNLDNKTVTCPAGHTTPIPPARRGQRPWIKVAEQPPRHSADTTGVTDDERLR